MTKINVIGATNFTLKIFWIAINGKYINMRFLSFYSIEHFKAIYDFKNHKIATTILSIKNFFVLLNHYSFVIAEKFL
jgi:hypothetical protein